MKEAEFFQFWRGSSICRFELFFQQMRTNNDDGHVHKLELGGSPPVPLHKRPLLGCNVCFERGKSGTQRGIVCVCVFVRA